MSGISSRMMISLLIWLLCCLHATFCTHSLFAGKLLAQAAICQSEVAGIPKLAPSPLLRLLTADIWIVRIPYHWSPYMAGLGMNVIDYLTEISNPIINDPPPGRGLTVYTACWAPRPPGRGLTGGGSLCTLPAGHLDLSHVRSHPCRMARVAR